MIGKTINVLLIENDRIDCLALERFIEKNGLPYRLETAGTLEKGSARLKASTYDVILLDYLLADGVGLGILSEAVNTPVIVITGNGNEQVAVEAMRRGAYDYLIKDHERNYLALLPTSINNVLLRKHNELRIEESEKRYRTIVETVSDIIFQLDPEQKITFINSAIRELGYEPENALGKSVEEFLCPEDRGKVKLIATRRVGARCTRNLEVRLQYKSGATEWHEMKKIAVLLDSYGIWSVPDAAVQTHGTQKVFVGTLCIARNITKRKQAEDALRESELRMRAILDNVADAIVTVNPGGAIKSFNIAGERIFGYAASEVAGGSFTKLLHDSSRKAYQEKAAGFWASEKHGFDAMKCELTGLRKDGSAFPLDLSLTRMEFEKNSLFIGIIRDITERKSAEEKLRKFAEELRRSNMELQGFASVVSHDLKEPLRKIIALGDRLLAAAAGFPDRERDLLERIQKSAARMQLFIDDLLVYSNLSARARKFERIDLDKIVEDVLADLEIRISQTRGTVNKENLPVLEADPLHMRQLFQNLISNGLKFHQENTPPTLELRGSRDGDGNWTIAVEDNGIGFDEKYADRVFRPFERLHDNSSIYEGTGLGLTICQKVVAVHGGKIKVNSVPGKGTTFFVTLPEKQSGKE
ncbi:MAG: PAS domain S-box protein [Nitrospinae bacterium]|nr:PAS domain S-box protein [Nitrospinota bacterium]